MSKDAHSKPSGDMKRSNKHSKAAVHNPEIQRQRRALPITSGRDAIIEHIRNEDVVVILGETGSGKTTQVPQYILEGGLAGDAGMIAITQPRRVAATSLADRVANEQEVRLGTQVGYSVRFDEKTSRSTRIKFVTDGMIMRELMSDPLLSKYNVVIVDEAHERTIRTDIFIASLKTIQKQRNHPTDEDGGGKSATKGAGIPPLKVIIMSATMDAEKFSKFFDKASIVYVKGRTHPVEIFHTSQHQADYVEAALKTFYQIHTDRPDGDVLIFLPGQEDIESLADTIRSFAKRLPHTAKQVLVCTMFASQPAAQIEKVFKTTPANTRKCILATNIAETSITIPGVVHVIDTGKHKQKRFLAGDTGGGFDTLLTRDISQSSAMQRTGRAGRESKGYCYRLYTEAAFKDMARSLEPEIARVGLASPMLDLLCLDIELEKLELLDRPDESNVVFALKALLFLGAIDAQKRITPLGRKMASFPLEPSHARAILASKDHVCTREVLDIISVLSASSKLFMDITEKRDEIAEARAKFKHSSGDHLTILNVVRSYEQLASETDSAKKKWCRKHFLNEKSLAEAMAIREQLRQVCTRCEVYWKVSIGETVDGDPVLRSLAAALILNAAILQPDGTYKQAMGHAKVKIHPGSLLTDKKAPAIIYDELVYTTQIYARGVSSIPKSDLMQMLAGALKPAPQ